MTEPTTTRVMAHQWTDEDGNVLILKFADSERRTYGGFRYPASGPVEPEEWDNSESCGNGLHGWPWGHALGDGKDVDYSGTWIILAAKPEDVVDLGGKCKCRSAEVVYCGTYGGAWERIFEGHVAWVSQRTHSGVATNSGDSGAATNSGDSGVATNSGDSGAATNSGERGAATNSGYSGAATNSGYSGAATNSGDRGAATNSGYRGFACNSGEYATVETSATGIAACTAERWMWRVRDGAIAVCRWGDSHAVFVADEMDVADGDVLKIESCKVVEEWTV